MSGEYALHHNLLAFLKKQTDTFVLQQRLNGKRPVSIRGNHQLWDGEQPYKFNLNRKTKSLEAEATQQPFNVRYLPWVQPKGVSFMKIDPKAHIVTTAQLSGCSMFVALVNGEPWMFHASDNSTNVTNAWFKRTAAYEAMRRLGGLSFCLSLEKGCDAYKKGSGGIFFGQRVVKATDGKSAWGFYFFNSLDAKVHRLASSDPGTNATLPVV
ncbi:MAG: hypothetical protein GY716_08345 [bacterium]|nr:hypothetical protein [bacterium]